jgi:hypothetical protein
VEIDGRWSYIDKAGKIAISTDFSQKAELGNFSEGVASVNADNGAKFIDKSGRPIIKTDFEWAEDFHGGAARVGRVERNGTIKYGYIDHSGRVIWRP